MLAGGQYHPRLRPLRAVFSAPMPVQDLCVQIVVAVATRIPFQRGQFPKERRAIFAADCFRAIRALDPMGPSMLVLLWVVLKGYRFPPHPNCRPRRSHPRLFHHANRPPLPRPTHLLAER